MSFSRRALGLTLAGLLSAWLLPAPSSAAPLPFCASAKPTYIEAFHVETKWNKKVYERSESAKVEVTVTRPVHKDPTGGPFDPPASVPEEGVTVTSAFMTSIFPPPFGRDITDAQGKVFFKIPLKSLKPGKYDARTFAEKWTNQGGCPDIVEWGDKYDAKILTIR